ncbi:MAG: hypothetical protein MUE79_03160 [Nitratireductor sp.]|jgi:hypothetical protein|nr:hypothetical protein [Nitratireductor sp.]
MKQLLSSCAAIALIAASASAYAGQKAQPGTIALSLGLGFGQVYADTYGSQANANTKNTYTSSAKASITPPAKEEPVECVSVCAESSVNGKKHPVISTEAHATATNESSTSVKGYADATARGFSLGAGWGAILFPAHSRSATGARSAAIAGGLSGSYSSSQGHASASGTGVGNATADATNGTGGQSSSSSAEGGATASASSSGNNGYASNTSGGASVGIGASY